MMGRDALRRLLEARDRLEIGTSFIETSSYFK